MCYFKYKNQVAYLSLTNVMIVGVYDVLDNNMGPLPV